MTASNSDSWINNLTRWKLEDWSNYHRFLALALFLGLEFLLKLLKVTEGLALFVSFELFLDLWVGLVHVIGEDFRFIDLLMNKFLSIFARQLVFRDVSKFLIHDGSLLTLSVKNRSAFRNLAEASHYSCMDKTDGLIYIRE